MPTNKVLLVWEIVPEDCRFYCIDNPSPEELSILAKANGHHINGNADSDPEIDAAMLYINLAVADYETQNEDPAVFGRWASKRVTTDDLPTLAVSGVYVSGFIL